MEFKSALHETLFSHIGAHIHVFLMLVFVLCYVFPFWISLYVPIIITTPFYPVFFMIGSYCLTVFNKAIGYVVFHMLFSLLSLGNLVFFTVEYSSAPTPQTRYNGQYCYPLAYGCSGARTLINVTYAGSLDHDDEYDSTGLDILVVWTWIWFAISIFNWMIALIIICEYATFTKPTDQAKQSRPNAKDYLCSKCTSNRDLLLASLSTLALIMFFLCFTQWILSLYIYTISVQILNPSNYNSLLQCFIAVVFIYLPRPSKHDQKVIERTKAEVKVHEHHHHRKQHRNIDSLNSYENLINGEENSHESLHDYTDTSKLLSEDSETRIIEKHLLEQSFYKLLIEYMFCIVLSLLFSVTQLAGQGLWMGQNDALLLNPIRTEHVVGEWWYLNFTNVEKFQFSANTEVIDTLQSNAFATFTFIFGVIDVVNILMNFIMILILGVYIYRLKINTV